MKNSLLFCIGFLFPILSMSQQNYPGGVPDAELWYKTTEQDLQNGEFNDYSGNDVSITACNPPHSTLFNFNPSLESEDLCLKYEAPLENVNTHNLFIVSEPVDNEDSYRHISTKFNSYAGAYQNSLSQNTYVIETQQGYASRMYTNFSQHQNTHVHFYSWSNYDIDRTYKSYGEIGEHTFFIGKHFQFNEVEEGLPFSGLMPEYISFDRSLTDNERNRVESYLALKYGITLNADRSYKSSKNKIFWDLENNNLFENDIFGIGRDDISGLHQLQCESAHNRDYLVAATNEIKHTNLEVQNDFVIQENYNFIVFGDTGDQGLADINSQNLRILKKIWLAQITGDQFIREETPIHFRLNLANEFASYYHEITTGELVVWMLHDQNTNNNYVSDFDNGQIEYYEPTAIEFTSEGNYVHFKEVFFDQDNSFYDQYTFAIGPKIIIQVRYKPWQCEGECFNIEILVTGAEEGHELTLLDGELTDVPIDYIGYNDEEQVAVYEAKVCGNQTFKVIYEFEEYQSDYEFEVEERNYTLDLGPDQFLNSQQQSIELDAGQGIDDPNAVYKWFYNGEQIYYSDSILELSEPGEYCVIVTTSDMSCQLEDCIIIKHEFTGDVTSVTGCKTEESYLDIDIEEGTSPYTVTVEDSNGFDLTFTDSNNSFSSPFIPVGNYTVKITDATGASFQETVYFNDTPISSGSLGSDQTLSSSQTSILLDGTLPFGNDPTYTYQWYRNGTLLSNTTSTLTVNLPGEYKVVVVHPGSDCNGEATIMIDHEIEGEIVIDSECEESSNTISGIIEYGLPNVEYELIIEGIKYSDGSSYYQEEIYDGSFTISGIPNGNYTVTLEDEYGGVIEQEIEFGLYLDLDAQLAAYCQICDDDCQIFSTCQSGIGAGLIYYDFNNCINEYILDASLLLTDQDVVYEWEMNGIDLNYSGASLAFEPCADGNDNPFHDTHTCDAYFTTVTVTDLDTGCSYSETIGVAFPWCPILPGQSTQSSESTLITNIYPNPSGQGATFYYDVSSEKAFDGVVELHDMNGRRIRQINISGQTSYTLPFSMLSSGVYFISTKTNGKLTTDRIIIE